MLVAQLCHNIGTLMPSLWNYCAIKMAQLENGM